MKARSPVLTMTLQTAHLGKSCVTTEIVSQKCDLPLPLSLFPYYLSQASSLEAEVMDNDNKVNCEFCGTKTTFTRRHVLRHLPPLLCLSLQRFVFDYDVSAGLSCGKFSCSCITRAQHVLMGFELAAGCLFAGFSARRLQNAVTCM